MVIGFKSFQEWFQGYEQQYAIIGGTACDLLMSDEGLDFRATKDIDLVLIIEAVTPEFGKHFGVFQKQYILVNTIAVPEKSAKYPYHFLTPF